MRFLLGLILACFGPLFLIHPSQARVDRIDLSGAVVISSITDTENPRAAALDFFLDEVEKRIGIRPSAGSDWSQGEMPSGARIVVATLPEKDLLLETGFPIERIPAGFGQKAEGFSLLADSQRLPEPVVWVVGNDDRGILFGLGALLRSMSFSEGKANIPATLEKITSPAYPLRGHQIGFRGKNNTWDAWTPTELDQHIRDLMIFGTNAIENIPFEDPHDAPLMRVGRVTMNRILSQVCDHYGLEYWLWMPVMEHRDEQEGTFALQTEEQRVGLLNQWDEFFASLPRVDGVFIPCSDPGDNKADIILPFMERVDAVLKKHHPRAKVWLSHQGLEKPDTDYLFDFLQKNEPDWFGGLVYGPWTHVSLAESRTRLPKKYPIRDYPDITHTIRCQFPVHHWDRAFPLTVGREGICPRPVELATLHNLFAADTNGFITYSDGVHDDVNKMLWNALGWDPDTEVRDFLREYGDTFIGSGLGDRIAEGMIGLESNWRGPLDQNVGIQGTLEMWQEMEASHPDLAKTNWRFQMGLLRAYYDAFLRVRLLHEQGLERQVYKTVLATSSRSRDLTAGSDKAIYESERLLRLADLECPRTDWRNRILELADALFETIHLQTSMTRHGASDYDRGTMIDMLDTPLNNRRWLEDQLALIRAMETEEQKIEALHGLANYEQPVPGTRYDDLGYPGHEPHLVRVEGQSLETAERWTLKDKLMSWEPYTDRRRLSRQDGIGSGDRWSAPWEANLRYVSLDRDKPWTFRFGIDREKSARYAVYADGLELKPMGPAATQADVEEYAIPMDLTADGVLEIEWKVEGGISLLLSEAWLIPSL